MFVLYGTEWTITPPPAAGEMQGRTRLPFGMLACIREGSSVPHSLPTLYEKLMRRIAIVLSCVLPCLVLARPVAAQGGTNLLTNGDFAAGLTGFTVSTSPGYIVFASTECSLSGPSGGIGNCAAFGTPGTGTGGASLAQVLTTTPGTQYIASLVTGIKPLGGGFDVFLAAAGQQGTVDCVNELFCVLTVPFTATALTTTVELGVRGYVPAGAPDLFASGTFIGDASVVTAAVVPEPAPAALLSGALLVLGGVVAQRRRAH